MRRDEEATRANERVFSPRSVEGAWQFRDQPPEFWDQYTTDVPTGTHLRIHPLLHWTEVDIWRYYKREGIHVNELYFARNGKSYRSPGDRKSTRLTPVTNAPHVCRLLRAKKNTQHR